MGSKKTSKKDSKVAAAKLKAPKNTKVDKVEKITNSENHKNAKDAVPSHLKTGMDSKLTLKAVEALLKFHEKQTEQKEKESLLGNEKAVQVQLTLLKAPGNSSPKPIRIMIPNPLFKLADSKVGDDDALEEAEICLIVKEESKPWCQELIEKFPDHMGCVKKVLGLQSLRKKHAQYSQKRELLNKYNIFMADDRILPMLSKALGKEFFKAKKLPIPINLTRKEALPFTIQKALSATFMTLSPGTCITIRAGHTGMAAEKLVENIVEIANSAALNVPHKWANVQVVSIKTPDSVALPIYNKTPEILKELAKLAGIENFVPRIKKDEEVSKKEKPSSSDSDKKRELTSPLLRALKKQKKSEKDNKEKPKKEEKSNKKDETMNDDDENDKKEPVEETKADETPKSKKKRSSSEGSVKEEKESAKKKKVDEKVTKEETPKQEKKSKKKNDVDEKEPVKTPESSSKNKSSTKDEKSSSSKKQKESKDEDDDGEKKDFIAAKKFKGSKKGYVFKMGKSGLGYYVDVKPVVDKMAMEAILRMGKNSSRRGGQKKNKYKGTRKF